MIDRVIPLTEPGPHWSQREYVAATKLKIGFAAHRFGEVKQVFHYHFPNIGCTSVIVFADKVETYIDHDFVPNLNWIDSCRSIVENKGRRG